MNLVTLASHTIDLDLLPERPTVLDVGCRDFDFTREILKLRPGARIIAMDPAPDVRLDGQLDDLVGEVAFINMALVGDDRAGAGFAHFSTGHGDFITDLAEYYDAEMIRVPCVNITRLMKARGIEHWDLVKLDAESSEFEILQNWPGPIATQLSVEFHDWDRPRIRDGGYYRLLFAQGLKDYRVVQHELSVQGTGCGNWDSVFVVKENL